MLGGMRATRIGQILLYLGLLFSIGPAATCRTHTYAIQHYLAFLFSGILLAILGITIIFWPRREQ